MPYSKKFGVLKVAKWLHENNKQVTHDRLFRFSKIAAATRHLRNDRKKRWQRGISHRTFRFREGRS